MVNIENTTRTMTKSTDVVPELTMNISTGKKLFKINCANCHNKDMKSKMTGPALGGVRARWSDYPITDLYDWVRNSLELVENGHPRAITLYSEWNRMPMPPFKDLSDDEITAILAYVESVK